MLRHDGRDYQLTNIKNAVKAKGEWDFFNWTFASEGDNYKISGYIKAEKQHFVGLNYYNPPKGSHTCLNCKIAECEVVLAVKGQEPVVLKTQHRAAFEILTDEVHHGVAVVA